MKFYFCEKCGKRVTETDISAGQGRDKKLRGVYCDDCAEGVMTLETLPMSNEEARQILSSSGTAAPAASPPTTRTSGRPSARAGQRGSARQAPRSERLNRTTGRRGKEAVAEADASADTEQKKGSRVGIYIGVAVAVLLALGGVAAMSLGGGKSKGKGGAQTNVSVPTTPAAVKGVGEWTKLFDGTSAKCFKRNAKNWNISNGALVSTKKNDAVQTNAQFDDCEVRIRFELKKLSGLYFAVRQGHQGKFNWAVYNKPRLRTLEGRVNEIIFLCYQESVTARLNGQSVPLKRNKNPRRGCLQFNASDGQLRVLSIEHRKVAPR